ncbi:hypothetical protein J4E05_16480 [Thalassospira sp. NFXS8]|uniref:tripartite tricarboxylate transporter substrate-binding protein n=1 Tax=Thalassospira sp. NFXS8 TaxID=2819093 RepID=UPI0032E0185B
MKKFLNPLALAAALLSLPLSAHAEGWTPPGPIKLMIGFAAGGGADTQARLIAQAIENKYGWKILPEQVTGNGGLNLAKQLIKEPADGTAIGMVVTETLTYSALAAQQPGLTAKNFTPLASTVEFQTGLVAMKGGAFDSWNKIKAAAKAGTPIRFGVATDRWADVTYLLGKADGIDFNIVQVKGGAGVMNGLRGGDLDLGWVAGAQGKPVQQGEMVNVASAVSHKLADSPNAPLITDLGSKYSLDGYFMFIAPKGLAPEARKAIGDAIADVLNDPATQAHALVVKSFGGPAVLTGAALNDKLNTLMTESKDLLATASAN